MRKLENLTQNELLVVKGGDYTETFVDDQGWTWSYTFLDDGRLWSFSVSKVSCTSAL